jgi:hypothetical protein
MMADTTFQVRNPDWALDLQRGLDSYMQVLYDGIDFAEDRIETLTGEPFCGCNDCEYREMLAHVVPRIVAGLVDRSLTVQYDGKPVSVSVDGSGDLNRQPLVKEALVSELDRVQSDLLGFVKRTEQRKAELRSQIVELLERIEQSQQ